MDPRDTTNALPATPESAGPTSAAELEALLATEQSIETTILNGRLALALAIIDRWGQDGQLHADLFEGDLTKMLKRAEALVGFVNRIADGIFELGDPTVDAA